MPTHSYLLDTNILIGALRGQQPYRDLMTDLAASGASLGCSVITIGELYAGMRAHEQSRTDQFLDQLDHHELTSAIARRAGGLKKQWQAKGRTIGLDDLFIAATAIALDLTLVTANTKDFPMPQLRLRGL